MPGRFEGLNDLEWKLFEDILPTEPKKRGRGMPHVPFRYVLNSLLYMLITGCRWCDLPKGKPWASKSAAHRWLKRWREDGTLEKLQGRVLGIAENQGLINWNYGAVDGSSCSVLTLRKPQRGRCAFPPGKGGGEGVAHGYKGKGILIHTLTDANGLPIANRVTPANGSEREQVLPLLDSLKIQTGKRGRPRKRLAVLVADKGYDSHEKRVALRRRGIRPQFPKRNYKTKKHRGRPLKDELPRFQQERCFAWYQRKYRRLVVRWERLPTVFDGFLTLALIHLWIGRITLVG